MSLSGHEPITMNTDEPSQNPAAGTGASNPLDQLLDSVRDHLDDSVPTEDDIPVLTNVVVAAPEATQEFDQDDLDAGQEPLAETSPHAEPYTGQQAAAPGDSTTADSGEISAGDPVNDLDSAQNSEVDEEFDVTQVAPLDDAEATQVTDVGQLPDVSARPEFDTTQGAVTEQPADEWDDSENSWDDDGEQFDATQVASLVDEPSVAQPIPVIAGDTPEPAPFDEEADDGADTLDGLQQTLVSAIGPSVSTADDSATQTQINEALLAELDQLIDLRCQAFAEALKQELRDTIDPGGNNTKS